MFDRLRHRDWHVACAANVLAARRGAARQSGARPHSIRFVGSFLQTTPGHTVSYEFVAQHLKTVFDRHHVQKIAFDRWNMPFLKAWLLSAGFSEQLIAEKFVAFGQGYQSMSPALCQRCATSKAHSGKEAASCVSNCVIERDAAGNKRLSKRRSAGRIDGMIALVMALGLPRCARR